MNPKLQRPLTNKFSIWQLQNSTTTPPSSTNHVHIAATESTMSDSNPDPGGVSIVVGTVKLIVNALISIPWLRYLSLAGRVLVWPLRIIIVPFSLVARVLLVVFSPLIYVLSFVLSCISTTFAFIASLEVRERLPFPMCIRRVLTIVHLPSSPIAFVQFRESHPAILLHL